MVTLTHSLKKYLSFFFSLFYPPSLSPIRHSCFHSARRFWVNVCISRFFRCTVASGAMFSADQSWFASDRRAVEIPRGEFTRTDGMGKRRETDRLRLGTPFRPFRKREKNLRTDKRNVKRRRSVREWLLARERCEQARCSQRSARR